MAREELIYVRVSEKTKKTVAALKESLDLDSNDILYRQINEDLKAKGVDLTINKEYIDSLFEHVDVQKLKAEIAAKRLREFTSEMTQKLGIRPEDMAKYLAEMTTKTTA
jgi:AAA15 family ATPase/GTPase